jgi:hypothetical protein
MATTFKELNLQVGTRMQMTVQEGIQQAIYYTELLGYANDEYLIVRTPIQNGLTAQILIEDLVIFRIFSGMNVIMFSCYVKAIFKSPHYYTHFSFPKEIKAQALRRVIRAKVDIPAQIKGVSKSVAIADISVAGAGIIADSELGGIDDEIIILFNYHIKLTNQDLPIEIKATIRSVRQLPDKAEHASAKFFHGIMFYQVDSTNHVMLQNLVYESLHG